MTDIFISYARSTAAQAQQIAEALRALGYGVWRDDELPAHRAYTDVIEERLRSAKAVVVVWSAEATRSQWVRAEAEVAREANTLVQLSIDGAIPPLPFNQIQCADLAGWSGDADAPGWKKIVASVVDLMGAGEGKPAVQVAAATPSATPADATSERTIIIVVPITTVGQGAGTAEFAEGLGEELIAALSHDPFFMVLSGAGGPAASPQGVARARGAHFALDGSVRQAGGRLRVSIKLTEAAAGEQVWAEGFEGDLDDVFGLQDRIAQSVAGQVFGALVTSEMRRAMEIPIERANARELMWIGLAHTLSVEPARLRLAIDCYDRALTRGGQLPVITALSAQTRAFLSQSVGEPERTRLRSEARTLAARALELSPGSATVRQSVAEALFLVGDDPAAARTVVARAVEASPENPVARFTLGWMQVSMGEIDRGVERLETAFDRGGPIRAHALNWLAVGRMGQGRYREAVALLTEAEQLRAHYPLNEPILAACLGHLGETRAALPVLQRIAAIDYDAIEYASRMLCDPALNRLFHDGLAKARGEGAS